DLEPLFACARGKIHHALGRAMRRNDARLIFDFEGFEGLGSQLHCRPVRLTAHDNGDLWLEHGGFLPCRSAKRASSPESLSTQGAATCPQAMISGSRIFSSCTMRSLSASLRFLRRCTSIRSATCDWVSVSMAALRSLCSWRFVASSSPRPASCSLLSDIMV